MAIAKSSLRILMVERFGEAFNQSSVRLRYTPRAFALDAANRAVYVAEADHATVPLAERPDLAGAMDDGAQVLDTACTLNIWTYRFGRMIDISGDHAVRSNACPEVTHAQDRARKGTRMHNIR